MSFIAHAASYGLILDHVVPDGRFHRVRTTDKPRKRNGAYIWNGDRGAVRNFATMNEFAAYRDELGQRVNIRDAREQARKSRQELVSRQHAAAVKAKAMLEQAELNRHPYLAKKGFPKEMALVLDGQLLVPMRDVVDYQIVNGLQRINADSEKLFLTGSKAAGSVFRIGNERAKERWLCEGYATALSLRAALNDLRRSAQAIVCFSAGNILHVAPRIRKPAYIMADNDRNGVGAAAAVATGLPWVMPPETGMDANDWHQAHGLRALVKVIQEI